MTCESTLEITHLIFLFKNVTILRQMLSVFSLIFKHFTISSNTFLVANTNQNEKIIAPLGLVCHGLQENAFQVNQLYNVTWSIVHYKSYQYKVSNLICSQKNPTFPCENGKQINDFNVNTIPPTFLKWVKTFLLLKRNVNYEFQVKLKGSVYCIRIEYALQPTFTA